MPLVKPQEDDLTRYLPENLLGIGTSQRDIPRVARDPILTGQIQSVVRTIPSRHSLINGDSRAVHVEPESVHLVLTSPPYWTLKEYPAGEGQLGHIQDYEQFLTELERVLVKCYEALVPGGRVVCVVGDVCLARKTNNGSHAVVPLHASIQELCRRMGFVNLAPIIWYKIANAKYEVQGSGGFLGKPYEPNAVIKNDIEYILMQKKPGGYRTPSQSTRVLSVIPSDCHREWFQQVWTGLGGASTRDHPAPFPLRLAERLVRMFSFVGDTVLDPFMGTGTTNAASALWARNSIGIELNSSYADMAYRRVRKVAGATIHYEREESHELGDATKGPRQEAECCRQAILAGSTPARSKPGANDRQERLWREAPGDGRGTA